MPFGFLALLAAFGTLANSLRSNSASVLIRTLLRCSARPNGGGIPLGSSASRTSPEWLARCAHLAGVGLPHFSTLTPRKARHAVPLHQPPLFLTPHCSSWPTTRVAPTTSLLTPQTSPLTPTPSLLKPHSSLLTPHSSLLTPHSSLLKPHSSLLTPHPSPLTPHKPHCIWYAQKITGAALMGLGWLSSLLLFSMTGKLANISSVSQPHSRRPKTA